MGPDYRNDERLEAREQAEGQKNLYSSLARPRAIIGHFRPDGPAERAAIPKPN